MTDVAVRKRLAAIQGSEVSDELTLNVCRISRFDGFPRHQEILAVRELPDVPSVPMPNTLAGPMPSLLVEALA